MHSVIPSLPTEIQHDVPAREQQYKTGHILVHCEIFSGAKNEVCQTKVCQTKAATFYTFDNYCTGTFYIYFDVIPFVLFNYYVNYCDIKHTYLMPYFLRKIIV